MRDNAHARIFFPPCWLVVWAPTLSSSGPSGATGKSACFIYSHSFALCLSFTLHSTYIFYCQLAEVYCVHCIWLSVPAFSSKLSSYVPLIVHGWQLWKSKCVWESCLEENINNQAGFRIASSEFLKYNALNGSMRRAHVSLPTREFSAQEQDIHINKICLAYSQILKH